MLKRITPLLYLLLLTIFLAACATPKPLEYRSFKNFQIDKIGFSSSSLKIDLVYFNPNNYGLQVKNTDIDIFINDVFLGHTSQVYQISIPKNDEFFIPITVNLDMKNMLQNSLNAFFSNQVKVNIRGTFKVGKSNTFISFPINYEGNHHFTIF